MIGNKIADKITNISKKPVKELSINDEKKCGNNYSQKKIYITEERQQIIDKLTLVPKNY